MANGKLKVLRGDASRLDNQDMREGNLLLTKDDVGFYADPTNASRIRLNDQPNWNETNMRSKAYVNNKPQALSEFEDDIPREGNPGTDGTISNISSVTATSTATTGTPSVTPSLGGTEANRTINFAFTGLKGEDGDGGGSDGIAPTLSAGTIALNAGTASSNPTVSVSKSIGTSTGTVGFTFNNLKGKTGQPGWIVSGRAKAQTKTAGYYPTDSNNAITIKFLDELENDERVLNYIWIDGMGGAAGSQGETSPAFTTADYNNVNNLAYDYSKPRNTSFNLNQPQITAGAGAGTNSTWTITNYTTWRTSYRLVQFSGNTSSIKSVSLTKSSNWVYTASWNKSTVLGTNYSYFTLLGVVGWTMSGVNGYVGVSRWEISSSGNTDSVKFYFRNNNESTAYTMYNSYWNFCVLYGNAIPVTSYNVT